MMSRTALTLAFSSLLVVGWSQNEPTPNVIKLESEQPRTVGEAHRITYSPKAVDTSFASPQTANTVPDRRGETSVSSDNLAPIKIGIRPKLPKLYGNYVRAGVGMYLTPIAELSFASKRDREMHWGAMLDHRSAWAGIKGLEPSTYDRSNADLFGTFYRKKVTVGADFQYGMHGFHYYGMADDSLVDKDSTAQRRHLIGTAIHFSKPKLDSSKVHWSASLAYRHFRETSPRWDTTGDAMARENFLRAEGRIRFPFSKNEFDLGLDFRYNGYLYGNVSDTNWTESIQDNNVLIGLKPIIHSRGEKWKAHYGAEIWIDARANGGFYIFPKALFQYRLFNDMFVPYLGVDGRLIQNSFYTVSQRNTFVGSRLDMRNEANWLDGIVGFKGTLTDELSFNLKGAYRYTGHKGFFVTDTTMALNQFTMVFDNLHQLVLEGSLTYRLADKWFASATARYNINKTTEQDYAWNMPTWETKVQASYNLFDKFLIRADLNLEGGRKAWLSERDPEVSTEPLEGVHYQTLGFLADANLGFEYRYNKRLSAFLEFNNLAHQKYDRWLGYQVQGITILGGLTFAF